MSIHRAFLSMFPHTIVYKRVLTVSKSGARTFDEANPKNIRCRIEHEVVRVISERSGKSVISKTQLFLWPTAADGSTYTPAIDDSYQLPAGFAPLTSPAESVGREDDQRGLHHFVVYL